MRQDPRVGGGLSTWWYISEGQRQGPVSDVDLHRPLVGQDLSAREPADAGNLIPHCGGKTLGKGSSAMTLEERSGTPIGDTSPFDDKSIRRLLVFCGHHRAGSTWLAHVLFAVADRYGLTYQKCKQKELSPAAEAFFQDHSLIDRAALPPYRGAHLIRDPRDIVVSGYFYHLWTEEKWAHVSKREFGGKS